jgi:enoyl-CoA hydratase/carnithine racemase
MAEPVLVERRDAVQWLTINRPERHNALNEAVVSGIAAGMRAAMADPTVRAVVLTGAGERAFCAGGDLNPTAEGAPFVVDPAQPRHYIAELFRLFEGGAGQRPRFGRRSRPRLRLRHGGGLRER